MGGCLRTCVTGIGILMTLASVVGIGGSLFLLFGGQPLESHSFGTYTPSWEDIGPAVLISLCTLVFSIVLVGGAQQDSKDMVLAWILWEIVALLIFWAW